MTVLCGIFWTIVGMGAQVAFVAGLAGGAYAVKCWLEHRHDREDERRRLSR